MSSSDIKMRLEALVAGPPTKKCKQVIAVMEKIVMAYPDRLKLDIYHAGMQLTISPTDGFQNEGKLKKIPSAFVNGVLVVSGEMLEEDELRETVESELARGERYWEK